MKWFRWDSSDPERAPPPLPLNPASSPSHTSRPNTSTAIQAHHAALTERARDSSYIARISPQKQKNDTLLDKAPHNSASHKRIQLLQPGHVRNRSTLLNVGVSTSTRSTEILPGRASAIDSYEDNDCLNEYSERRKENDVPVTPTKDVSKGRSDVSAHQQAQRRPQSHIFGGSSPQSSTMLALHEMDIHSTQGALTDITNGSSGSYGSTANIEGVSAQIVKLTSIATNLQREMIALSRRSKDNATDLVSLKAATNARDEDIRKSLRELVLNINDSSSRASSMMFSSPNVVDDRQCLPTIEKAGSKSLPGMMLSESGSVSMSRNNVNSASGATISETSALTLLQKVLREMGTKSGQDLLVAKLTAIADHLDNDGATTAKQLEELVNYIRSSTSTSQAIVTRASNRVGSTKDISCHDFDFGDTPRLELDCAIPTSTSYGHLSEAKRDSAEAGRLQYRAAEPSNTEVLSIIRSVKDGVAQGGGLTAEVKALVRDLRGEVLGMGREMGRRLDQVYTDRQGHGDKHNEDDIIKVVREGLTKLMDQMERLAKQAQTRTTDPTGSWQAMKDDDIHDVVKAALVTYQASTTVTKNIGKEDVVEAVREAWENYKPDIEVQHFGLERDELLACLREGFEQHKAPAREHLSREAMREEVFTAVVDGFKHFDLPAMTMPKPLTKDDVLKAFRSCLENAEPRPDRNTVIGDLALDRAAIIDAVKEGLDAHEQLRCQSAAEKDTSRVLEVSNFLNQDDNSGVAPRTNEAEIAQRLEYIIDQMEDKFREVSEEAKENVAAHGRDTEQILDSHKDGMEKLRTDIQNYISGIADTNLRDDILNALTENFASSLAEITGMVSKGSEDSLNAVRHDLEDFKSAITTLIMPDESKARAEIVSALRHGFDDLRVELERSDEGSGESTISGTGEILDALHDGLSALRGDIEKITSKPVEAVDMTINYEILDTLKQGLCAVRADLDRLKEHSANAGEMDDISGGAVMTAEGVPEKHGRNDIANLEVLVTQLRIKIDALESLPSPLAQAHPDALCREHLKPVEDAVECIQNSLVKLLASANASPVLNESRVQKEDIEAIETLLRNTKARIDEMDPDQVAKKEHVDNVEIVVREVREGINEVIALVSEDVSKEEIVRIENLISDLSTNLLAVKDLVTHDVQDVERINKQDIENIEVICTDLKVQAEKMACTDFETLTTKKDVDDLAQLITCAKDEAQGHAEANTKAFEERQAEVVGLSQHIDEVKSMLKDVNDTIVVKVEAGATGVDAVRGVLADLGSRIDANTMSGEGLLATIREEFEKTNAGVVGVKVETEDHLTRVWEQIQNKLDELRIQHDTAQADAKTRGLAEDERVEVSKEVMDSTKAVVEDVKLLMETLGTTVVDSVEKMETASKTVFDRVEDTYATLEDARAETKAEHQIAHEQTSTTIRELGVLQGKLDDQHPKIMDAIRDVLIVVEQHYEHSKTTADNLTETVGKHFEHSVTSSNVLQEKIEARPTMSELEGQNLLKEAPEHEIDNSQIHDKLEKLMDYVHRADNLTSQTGTLATIHDQVMKTAEALSLLISQQESQRSDEREDKAKVLQEAELSLERMKAENKTLEDCVEHLRCDEGQLRQSIRCLTSEADGLSQQKLRLAADVASLETALQLRREELRAMEDRAENLERRILDGVIDHSRAFMLTKSNVGRAGRHAMNLKRVASSTTSLGPSVIGGGSQQLSTNIANQNAVTMTMGGARARMVAPSPGTSRRILSLNQILPNGGIGAVQRSYSPKAAAVAGTLRQSSWAPPGRKSYGNVELNKENLALHESDNGTDATEIESDSETMRISSVGTMYADSVEDGTNDIAGAATNEELAVV